MPEMPSADVRTGGGGAAPARGDLLKEVEGLVLEIKENLRLSSTMKALPCGHLSRKSSRASPYRVPGRPCCDAAPACDAACLRRTKRRLHQDQEDPYELLQKLLRDGGLVSEAVRRVQMGLSPKQRYFYESDEEASPVLRLYHPQES